MKGLLFVITAPSGAGKSSLIDALLKEDPRLKLSISYTTRTPRPGEQDGREYHFVDKKTFLGMLERSEFFESAEVHGNHYGTSQAVIREALARGQDLVLEIDWQGAQQVRRLLPECIGVFIQPPSVAELERRMRSRGQDADEVIRRRLASAEEEMSHAPEFNYVIINKDFDEAKRDLQAIIRVERLKKSRL
jgi:guanylate kinase